MSAGLLIVQLYLQSFPRRNSVGRFNCRLIMKLSNARRRDETRGIDASQTPSCSIFERKIAALDRFTRHLLRARSPDLPPPPFFFIPSKIVPPFLAFFFQRRDGKG